MSHKPTYQQLESRIRELEEKQADILVREEECREFERNFSAIVRTVPDIIYRLDPEGRITYVNETVRQYGYDPGKLLGCHILDLVAPEHREKARYKLNERRTGERRTRAFEISLMASDGKITKFEIHSGAIVPEPLFLVEAEGIYSGNTPGTGEFLGTQGVARDITQRKLAEMSLRESEARLASVFRTSPAGIGIVSNRTFTMVNDRLCRMLGYTREELIGQSARLVYVSSEEFERVGAIKYNEVKTKGTGTIETQWKRKDGAILDILLSSSPIDPSCDPRELTFAALDITENRKVENLLRQAQKMEAVGRLAGGIAHDFNNLLMVITGNVEIIHAKYPDAEIINSQLNQISSASDRAAALTKQLLAFSRSQVMRLEPINLNQVIGNLANLFNTIIGEDVEIDIRPDKELGPIRADAGQIEQILMNLVVNARDAMPNGGRIVIKTSGCMLSESDLWDKSELKPGRYACLSVSDNGLGMDEQTRSKVFEPFFTTKKIGRGSGLGLSTVYGIVKQFGGDIHLSSSTSHGTSFRIFLPLDSSGESVKSGKLRPGGSIMPGSETLLVVEDEKMVLSLTEKILLNAGYKVLITSSPEEALEIFQREQHRIDLVITDVIMPRISGRVLADRIQHLKPETRVLFMSGYTDNAITEKGILGSDTHFISKPFRSSELTHKIRNVLDGLD